MTAAQEKSNILIVEDNPLTLYVLIEYLERLNLNTSVARSGEEAIRQVEILKPDLILSDVLMPGIDGFETCRRLKSSPSTKDIPVMFITALSNTSDRVKGFEAGGIDYITKPFDFKEVAARINTRLTIQKLQRRLKNRENVLSFGKRDITSDEKATILIVEDNSITLHLLQNYLDKFDFKTLRAQSGEEAMDIVKDSSPDIILLDVILRGIDGFETCRRLKANSATKKIPVIFMTALSDADAKIKGFEVGGVDYITKPHHYSEVINRVKTHLTIRTLQRLLQKQKIQAA
ncbi:MAG: response regulator [bacterium]|nr:response regulator [bacterium]